MEIIAFLRNEEHWTDEQKWWMRDVRANVGDGGDKRPYIALLASEANAGSAKSARRLAEILEFIEQADLALAWWQKAADLGDRVAELILRDIQEEEAERERKKANK